ncbi:medium-chain acyl-CoA ligase ACSF2, mitochondrial-like isoform X2 [Eurosta solidaginis]
MQPGDYLGLWITNHFQWYVSYLAAGLAGYPIVCINPALQAKELAYALKKAKVKTLITMEKCGKQNFYEILKQILPAGSSKGVRPIQDSQFPELQHIIIQSKTTLKEFISWDEFQNSDVSTLDLDELNNKVEEISPESACTVQFTSGTTGLPKVALLSHFAGVNQGYYLGRFLKLHKEHKYVCLSIPFFHAFGLSVLMATLNYGATLVLPSPRFDSVATLDCVEREGCNIIFGTPTMYVDLLDQQRRLKKPLPTLQSAMVGGAACSPEIFTQMKSVFGLEDFIIGYGMSETSAASFTQNGTESIDEAAETVGCLYEHIEAKVIDNRGEIVRYGEIGELCIRGYTVMTEYMGDKEKTKEVLDKHGWLKTGDLFILESNGVGRIIGRAKDVIIRGGENIFPKEVEDYLDTHEDILEAQIIGVPDKRMGEEMCAYIRLRAGAKHTSVEDVKNFCKGNIAHFKVPRYVRFIKEYPKTASGKIQKFELVKLFQKELES